MPEGNLRVSIDVLARNLLGPEEAAQKIRSLRDEISRLIAQNNELAASTERVRRQQGFIGEVGLSRRIESVQREIAANKELIAQQSVAIQMYERTAEAARRVEQTLGMDTGGRFRISAEERSRLIASLTAQSVAFETQLAQAAARREANEILSARRIAAEREEVAQRPFQYGDAFIAQQAAERSRRRRMPTDEEQLERTAGNILRLSSALDTLPEKQRRASLAQQQLDREFQEFNRLIEGSAARNTSDLAVGQVLRMQAGAERAAINAQLRQAAAEEYANRVANEASMRESIASINEASRAYDRLARAEIREGRANRENSRGRSSSLFQREAQHIVGFSDSIARGSRGQAVSSIGAALRDAGLGGGVLLGGVAGLAGFMIADHIKRSAQALGEWANSAMAAAQATGMTVQQYTQLQGALETVGLKGNAADGALRKFASSLSEASQDSVSRAALAFHALGISQEQIGKNGGNVIGMLMAVADAMKEHAADANLARVAVMLFGQEGEKLIQILRGGSVDLLDRMNQAQKDGVGINHEQAQALADTSNKINELGTEIRGRAIAAFIAWKPEIDTTTALFKGLVTGILDAVGAIGKLIGKIGEYKATLPENVQNVDLNVGTMGGPMSLPEPESPVATAAIPRGSNVNAVKSFFQSRGYSPQAIAAIMGNIQVESNFNPNAVGPGNHRGLIQLDANRFARLKSITGTDHPSIQQQLEFLDKEISERDPGFKTATGSVSGLTSRFEGKIEVSGGQLEGQRESAAQGFFDSFGKTQTAAAPSATIFNREKFTRDLNEEIRTLHEQTQKKDAELRKQIASARHNEAEQSKIEGERARLAEEAARKEKEIRDRYAQQAVSSGLKPDDSFVKHIRDATQSETAITNAQTQEIQARNREDDANYRRFAEREREKISQVRASEEQIIQQSGNSAQARISAARDAADKIKAIYDEWLSQIINIYHQDSSEFDRVQKDKANATRSATREMIAAQRAAQAESARHFSAEHGKAEAERSMVDSQFRLREIEQENSGAGPRTLGRTEIAAAQADAAEAQRAAKIEFAAAQELASAGKVEEAETKIAQIRARLTQQEVADYEKASAAWKKMSADISSFFGKAGAGFSEMTSSITKAIFSPQVDIIHAGLTTIKENERGREIRQAIGNMLLKAIDAGVNSVESAVSKVIGNMLAKAASVPGGDIGTVLGNIFTSKVLGEKIPKPSDFGLGTGLTTSTASLQAFNSALAQSTALLTGHGTAVGTSTGAVTLNTGAQSVNTTSKTVGTAAETTRTTSVVGNSLATTMNTTATTANSLATETNSMAQSAGGIGGFLKGIPIIGGLLSMFDQGGIVPSAAGGMVVGGLSSGTLSLLHPREMVLPSHLSDGLQGMINNGGAGRANGPIANLTYSPNINTGGGGMSRSQFGSMLNAHSTDMIGRFKEMINFGWRP